MPLGRGTAHAGISVLNAIGTGIGGALGIDLTLEVEVMESSSLSGWSNGHGLLDEEVLWAIHRVASGMGASRTFHARVISLIPPSRGLKSSSALVNAMLAAVLEMHGVEADRGEIARKGVEAARLAGLTITGAYDDSLATLLPGVHITDNTKVRRLRTFPAPRAPVVLLIPREENPIQYIDPSRFKAYKELYMKAAKMALAGRWIDAIPINSLATIHAAGLRDLWAPLEEALSIKCTWTAGVSGKGPALFSITSCPSTIVDLWRRQGDIIVTETRGDGT
ncbi:MAG: shikimate kinase [Desulfurococcales archaeon]|nr:shikimate kinase [Desulfurococcales archaeon]